ncbi:MAG: ABC transporter substrate-binding protein [Treponema sp.]|nr:ABC transporter substrate-binding protein [Treponema sp.]
MPKKTMEKFLFAAAILTALALGGCGGEKSPKTAGQDGRNAEGYFVLRAVNPLNANETPVGHVLGFFREEGIEIEFIGTTEKGVTDFQLLDMKQIDFAASGHPPELARAILTGAKLKAVASGMVDNPDIPHVRYLVREDSPIKTLDDIVGKKVGLRSVGACQNGYLQYYLKNRGLDPEGVEFIIFGSPGLAEQSISLGVTDLVAGHPPYAEKVFAAGGVREVARSWDIFHSPGAGVSIRSVREELIEQHPEVVQGLVNALYKTRLWMNAHPEETKDVLAEWIGIEKGDLSTFWYDPNKNIDPSYIDKWFEISEDLDLWKHGDIYPEDIYTNAFVPKDIDEDWAKR